MINQVTNSEYLTAYVGREGDSWSCRWWQSDQFTSWGWSFKYVIITQGIKRASLTLIDPGSIVSSHLTKWSIDCWPLPVMQPSTVYPVLDQWAFTMSLYWIYSVHIALCSSGIGEKQTNVTIDRSYNYDRPYPNTHNSHNTSCSGSRIDQALKSSISLR